MTSTDWITLYRESAYSFPQRNGRWLRFTLTDLPAAPAGSFANIIAERGSLTLITAWNPMSVERPLSVNGCANAQLRNDLEAAGVAFEESYGSSLPGVEPLWREDGFVLFGLSQEQAEAWGRAVQQRSLVWMNAESVGLLFCEGTGFVPCGLKNLAPR
jgi:hypothetical protein